MKRTRRILCVILALALMFALAIPAFAVEPRYAVCSECGQMRFEYGPNEYIYSERVNSCSNYSGIHNHELHKEVITYSCGCGTTEKVTDLWYRCPYA